ncbi:MAG: class I SAM-dependent methyltransferase [Kiritimatiellae bacterium]|nr:class I SAM-dependent methyltransferase [Kiritimatiellia bacterium]
MNMRELISALLNTAPYIGRLRREKTELAQQLSALSVSHGNVPPGHYYSPVPRESEIEERLLRIQMAQDALLGVDLNDVRQSALLEEFASYYGEQPFKEEKTPGCRYYFGQDLFCCTDAIFLYCFLRKFKPGRIVEVGSGFSSAAMLDTADRLRGWDPSITFIEPEPTRLLGVLTERDRTNHRLLAVRLQDAPMEVFTSLESGDLLFLDSSHVVKCGSDVQMLIFDILPRLKEGVFVHFHDIFYPGFEYPAHWLHRGTFLNEAYFLRAFLMYNTQWEVYWFNGHIAAKHRSFLAEHMPLCLKEMGSSIFLRKGREGAANTNKGH